MADTPTPSGPEPPADPDRTDADPRREPPVWSNVWWGTGVTRTFMFGSVGTDPSGADPGPGGATIDLRPPGARRPDPEPAERVPAPPPPGRYLLEPEIGRGGVGLVHRAWDIQLKRAVAIKVLREEHKNKTEVVRRFLEEARITSRLHHPGIVPIHELGVAPDGRPFFVMGLVSGKTLEQALRDRTGAPSELPALLAAFLQVCQAIAYAHSQGVIHRDLKPANVMVGPFGVVKVMDWGLAKVLGEPELSDVVSAAQAAAELTTRCGDPRPPGDDLLLPGTQIGTVFGTPAYLPPEQARGEIGRIDAHADVFGLGSLLCEILTGQPPYTGDNGRAIYDKAATGELADAFARLNACPAPLDVVTLAKWCLSPDPTERPTNAGDVVEVMTAFMQAHQRRAEQDLVRFFDLSLDLFCIAGTDGYFQRVNENFPRLLGYTAQELTARPFVEFVHPDDRAKTAAEVVRLSCGDPCIQFQNRYRHARGHYVWLEWSAQTVPEERAIYAVARDVTERVAQSEAHRAAEEARQHLAAVVNSADLAIISTTFDGIVRSWNRGAERLFGYSAGEMVGRSVAVLVPPGREQEEVAVLARLRHCERVEHSESVRRRKDGSLVTVALTVSPVLDDEGNVIGASKIAREVSGR